MPNFKNEKLIYIIGFSVWFSLGMTGLKLYVNYDDLYSSEFGESLAFTFMFWFIAGGVFGYSLWLKMSKQSS